MSFVSSNHGGRDVPDVDVVSGDLVFVFETRFMSSPSGFFEKIVQWDWTVSNGMVDSFF